MTQLRTLTFAEDSDFAGSSARKCRYEPFHSLFEIDEFFLINLSETHSLCLLMKNENKCERRRIVRSILSAIGECEGPPSFERMDFLLQAQNGGAV